ncbi:MAG: hypothetical protein ACP5Q1_12010 [Anaerolineae bacterium]
MPLLSAPPSHSRADTIMAMASQTTRPWRLARISSEGGASDGVKRYA